MRQPHRILCVKIGEESPTQSEILSEVQRVHYQYGDLHKQLADIDELDCNAQVGTVPGFPDIDQLIRLAHSDGPPQGASFVCVNLLARLVTIITFPESSPPSIFPLDGQAGSHLARLKNIVTSRAPSVSKQLSPQDEIRHLLAGNYRHRRGLFLAGSPGWNSASDNLNRSELAQNKNNASLAATLNDANAMFHLFHSLTNNDHLTGLVAGFLIREKVALHTLLHMLPFDADRHGNANVLSPLIPEHGLITFDTKLFGSFDNKGRTIIIGGAGIGFGETIGERMHNSSTCEERLGHFAVIYYSGHGSSEGNMQIEEHLAITPEEVCDLSRATGVPYLIILDMCFASRFGSRYRDLLRKQNWSGIVMCANDTNTSGGLSFESKIMGSIRRPYWRMNILDTDWSKGRGIYTTAFTLAIQQLREHENATESHANLSIEDFNEYMLRPICEGLNVRHGLPLLRPTIFSST
jgi:hypothetical protein